MKILDKLAPKSSIPVKATVANDSLLIGSPEPLLGHRKRKFMDPRIGWIALACVLLLGSCCVMITAWYLHLKFEHKWNLPLAIFISWLIAGVEYILQVPANRIGHTSGELSSAQLRAIAEVLIILAFIGFSSVVLREPLLINHVVGFAIVVAGVWLVLLGPFKQVLYHRKDSSDITILDANNTIRVNTTAMEA